MSTTTSTDTAVDMAVDTTYSKHHLRKKGLKKFRPERDSNPDLCDAGALLYQFSYQANSELVIMWVYDKPVDSGYMLLSNEISFELRRNNFHPFSEMMNNVVTF